MMIIGRLVTICQSIKRKDFDMQKQNLSKLTKQEKHIMVERLIIRYPFFNHINSQLKHCHNFSKISAEPECILITGVRGAGKTTALNNYAMNFPRKVTSKGTIVPILKARVPVPASPKSLVTELLDSLGDPNPSNGSTTTQTKRLKKLIKDCKVEMVLLDEFHQFIDRDSYSILYGAADWLKNLIDDTKRPFALWGLSYSSVILKANEQLERRFAIRETIKPFIWTDRDIKSASNSVFFKFLKHLDDLLPFPENSNLSSEEMAFRIYYATDGVVGFIMKLIRRAAFLAIEKNMKFLNLEVLAKAYEERLSHRDPTRKNPFKIVIKNLNLTEIKNPTIDSPFMPSRIKGKKSKLKELIESI